MLIYNPQSGQGLFTPFFQHLLGSGKEALPFFLPSELSLQKIQNSLLQYGIHPQTTVSLSAAQATRVARRCAQKNYDLVIAAGGDGTINAIVNGLAGSKTALGLIPIGSMNIFGMQLDIPGQLEKACRVIAEGCIQAIDLGKVNTRYFACMAGIGFDAFVIKATDQTLKKIFGVLALALAAFFGFFVYPFSRLRLQIDQDPKVHKGYSLIVGNVKYYGGKLVLLPAAKITDGYLDVCLFKKRGFFNLLGYLWGLRQGELGRYLDVQYFRCRELRLLKGKHDVHIDGEYFGRTHIAVKIVPKSLRVVV